MKRFQFRLESILQIKIKTEAQERQHFAEVAAALTDEEEKLSALIKKKEELDDDIRRLMAARLDLLKLRLSKEMSEAIKERIKEQREAVSKAEQRLEAARKRLNLAMIERKTYEALREKEFENYKAELLQEESKETDERTSFKFSQKEREAT